MGEATPPRIAIQSRCHLHLSVCTHAGAQWVEGRNPFVGAGVAPLGRIRVAERADFALGSVLWMAEWVSMM